MTNIEYKQYLSAMGKNFDKLGSNNKPVVFVSFKDAEAYALWLSCFSGKKYRLPTESEWLYATKANTKTDYYWGNRSTLQSRNWLSKVEGASHKNSWLQSNSDDEIHDVGLKNPNSFGLYDTIGNAWEWCYNRSPKHGKTKNTVRGGGWNAPASKIISRTRVVVKNEVIDQAIGFRLVMDEDLASSNKLSSSQ